MAQPTTIYQDIDLSFELHPNTGDFLKKFDANAAKFALENLLMIRPGEIPDNPYLGIGIPDLIFELYSPITAAFVKRNIQLQVGTYLPEISLTDIAINMVNSELVLTLQYYVIGNPQLQTYTLNLTRIR